MHENNVDKNLFRISHQKLEKCPFIQICIKSLKQSLSLCFKLELAPNFSEILLIRNEKIQELNYHSETHWTTTRMPFFAICIENGNFNKATLWILTCSNIFLFFFGSKGPAKLLRCIFLVCINFVSKIENSQSWQICLQYSHQTKPFKEIQFWNNILTK